MSAKYITQPNLWYFEDSGSAYDISQTDDRVKDGDILVVPSEKAVAIMVEAWPIIIDGFDEDLQHDTAFDGPLEHTADWDSVFYGKYAPAIEAWCHVPYIFEPRFKATWLPDYLMSR